MFMGMPVTSVIARSSLNARLNASTRLPALVQAGFVFSSVVFMSGTIAMIPMPALSGVLITTGMGMLYPAELKHCYAVQKSDAIPFAATIGGMVSMGLAEGIGIGCVTALGMNAFQTYQTTTTLTGAEANQDNKMKAFELIQLPKEKSDDEDMIWQARCGTQLPMQLDARGMHTMTSSKTSSSTNTPMMDPSKNTIWQLNE